MEAQNQAEMLSTEMGYREDIVFAEIGDLQDELAWKLKIICTTKEVAEDDSSRMSCHKAHYLGNSRHQNSESADLTTVCLVKPSTTNGDPDLSSCVSQNDDDMSLDCRTPIECIFDSFAPGPEVLVCAPKKKMFKEIKVPFRRQLNFDACDDSSEIVKADVDDATEEVSLFNFIYESFLDLILTSQLKELSANKLRVQDNGPESPKTPTSLPLLTGVSETCPPAPMRLPARSKLYFPGICRKLDFGQT